MALMHESRQDGLPGKSAACGAVTCPELLAGRRARETQIRPPPVPGKFPQSSESADRRRIALAGGMCGGPAARRILM